MPRTFSNGLNRPWVAHPGGLIARWYLNRSWVSSNFFSSLDLDYVYRLVEAFTQVQVQSTFGVIYVCFGETYRLLTVLSVSYLRRTGYSGPIRILTDDPRLNLGPLGCEVLSFPSCSGFSTRHYKTQLHKFGFDSTVFLDADTIPLASLSPAFGQSWKTDFAATRDYHPDTLDLATRGKNHKCTWLDQIPVQDRRRPEYEFMSSIGLMRATLYNSGAMMFRRTPAVCQLFDAWHEEWKRFGHEDQLALVRAIAHTNCPVATLGRSWSYRLRPGESLNRARLRGARVVHLRPANQALIRKLSVSPAYGAPGALTEPPLVRRWVEKIAGGVGRVLARD